MTRSIERQEHVRSFSTIFGTHPRQCCGGPEPSESGPDECDRLLVPLPPPMTTKSKIKSVFMYIVAALVVSLLTAAAYNIWTLREPLCAKLTESRMKALMNVLDVYRPDKIDPESLRPLLAKHGGADLLKDGWSRPLVVERTVKDGRPLYTITSLGRDGRRGPCCKPVVFNWDDDAVLAGDKWLQVWSSRGVPPPKPR
jgi:hypothetical protein